ncbi:cytochrome P450 [Mycena pura]|uniref:Cytochrome P450 n=1 Tax=Mycena pura TaxID=153505 RepID=A0AAD6YMQ1_9AGAR|nr:cytochrome P450 [Mycena pura]
MLIQEKHLLVAGIGLVFSLFYHHFFVRRKGVHPPGPFRWPLVGNLFQVPRSQAWIEFTKWKREYGQTGSGDVCGFGATLVLRNYDQTAKETRKLLHTELNPRAVQQHSKLFEEKAQELCHSNIERPEDFLKHIRHMVVSIIMMVTYGHHVSNEEDEFVEMAQKVMENLSMSLQPNRFLVDSLPLLRYVPQWFPGAKFQRLAAEARLSLHQFLNAPFSAAVRRIESHTALPSLITNILTSSSKTIDVEILKAAAGEMYGGMNCAFVISSFYLAMVYHPEVQSKAYAEILSVLGPGRLPSIADRSSLPYVNAIVQECLRWNPPFPFAGHCLSTDDIYRGFLIPSGTFVMANTWALTHDETLYPNPNEFNPDRFAYVEDGNRLMPNELIFGWGRRSCPGSHLAESVIFTAVATTLALCEIRPEVDITGKEILPPGDFANTGALKYDFVYTGCCNC